MHWSMKAEMKDVHVVPFLSLSVQSPLKFLNPRLQINLSAVHLSEAINYGDEKEKYQSQAATSLTIKLLIK